MINVQMREARAAYAADGSAYQFGQAAARNYLTTTRHRLQQFAEFERAGGIHADIDLEQRAVRPLGEEYGVPDGATRERLGRSDGITQRCRAVAHLEKAAEFRDIRQAWVHLAD